MSRPFVWRATYFLVRWAVVAAAVTAAGIALLFWFHSRDLPDVTELGKFRRPAQIVLLDHRGKQFAVYGPEGEPIRLSDLPAHVFRAVMAIEDRRFYEHEGYDPTGIARSIYVFLRTGRLRQGGSTITQQLAKIAFLSPEKSVGRKLREIALAVEIDRHYTKDEILTFYLNRAYFGEGAWGIDGAARRYFGVTADKLTLYQSAILAGMLQRPVRNPVADREGAIRRAELVLWTMVGAKFISEQQLRHAKANPGRLTPPRRDPNLRYFGHWIVNQLADHVSLTASGDGDIVVRTTLDAGVQAAAQRHLQRVLAKDGERLNVGQAAVIVMTPQGAVRAMLGGRDYTKSEFNRATRALRQPGSVFKLFVLVAALEAGLSLEERVIDQPVTVGSWSPRNFDGKFKGEMSLRDALAHSRNTVAVQISERVGRAKVAAVAERLGVRVAGVGDPTLALGTREATLLAMTVAYSTIANGGRRGDTHGILQIASKDGKVIFRRERESEAEHLVAERHVRSVNDALSAVIRRGTGRRAAIGRPAAGKTGTTQDNRDAWFIGYTRQLVAAVWLGNDDNAPMHQVTGGTLPAAIWAGIMREALGNEGVRPLDGVPEAPDPDLDSAEAPPEVSTEP